MSTWGVNTTLLEMLAGNTLLRTTARAVPCSRSASKAAKKRTYATLADWKPHTPTWIDKNTKVICQGLTGKQVRIKHLGRSKREKYQRHHPLCRSVSGDCINTPISYYYIRANH